MRSAVRAGVGALVTFGLFFPVMLHESKARVAAAPAPVSRAEGIEVPVRLLFVGDVMLDRGVAHFAKREGAQTLFADVENIFAEHDIIVGNLEGTITDNVSLAQASSTVLRFTFEPKMADVLADAGFTVMSMANNHSLDFGKEGYIQTRSYLSDAGIASFGSPLNNANVAIKTTSNNRTICFVGYHELFRPDPAPVVEKLTSIESACSYSVVFTHWGKEYEHNPSTNQRELAHLFVESGADLVIGAHPHAVQPVEIYKNVAIFYSLGNFLFDQGIREETKRGVMVSVELTEEKQHFTLIPVNTYLEATRADEEISQAVLTDLGIDSPTFTLSR